jgi:cysteine desulfurase
MEPFLREHFGNPSSTHSYGRLTRAAVERSRQQVAALLGAKPEEIVFTSGGSEASNQALKGVVLPALAKSAAQLNGHPQRRLPNTLNVNFVGHVGAELLEAVPEIAASTGSACHEGQVHLSPVLEAMGLPPELGRGAVRLSVGRFTTAAEVDRAAGLLVARASTK